MRALILTLTALAGTATAQQQITALASRAELQAALSRAASSDPQAAARLRLRLEQGDFQTGDQLLLRVEGEPQLSDTFTVGVGPALELPGLPALPLAGVLRAELSERVATHLRQFLRDPVIEVRPLLRLLVEGDVARPGFYPVEPAQPLADVITAAGGFTQRAKANGMRIERAGEELWSGQALQQAIGRGASLDQLGLRAGDRLFVPSRGDSESKVRMVGLLLSIPVAIYSLTRIF